jgi:hypothetical protein
MRIGGKFVSLAWVVAAAGLALTGCSSAPSVPKVSPDVGYIDGVAYPCVGVGGIEPGASIRLAIVGPAPSKFAAPTRGRASDHRFRFQVAPGNYRIYEDQRFSSAYERVGGPFSAHVVPGATTNVTVGNGCK